jgi:antagonist of KipI
MNFPAPELLFRKDEFVSITGQGCQAYVNDNIFSPWKPLLVKEGAILRFEKTETGSRAYLAVHGGWKAQEWLGSFTTHLGVKAGGLLGRTLQKGDTLEVNGLFQQVNETKTLPWGISKNELDKIYLPLNEIRIAASVETDLLSEESKERLLTVEFKITNQSSRMGYRLEGEKLILNRSIELVSSPVDFGTIQLLPDGNLIILMADHQTIGGYPRIASVIKPDLPKLAQKSANDKIKFRLISLNEAESELQSREKLLEELKQACLTQYKNYFKIG